MKLKKRIVKKEITSIAEMYNSAKKKLKDDENGLITLSENSRKNLKYYINYVDTKANYLSDDDALIINFDVLQISDRHWYLEYMSVSTYYVHRDRAYNKFLHLLEDR